MAQSRPIVWLHRLPLQVKAVTVAVLCSGCVWLSLDYWQSRRLQEFAATRMAAELSTEAASARLVFDREVKRYSQLVSLFAARGPAAAALEGEGSTPPMAGSKPDRGSPPWVPKISQWRGLIDPEHFVLFSPQGRIVDRYALRGAELPEDLDKNGRYFVRRSTGQTYFGKLNGRPYLMATAAVADDQGGVRGYLMVVAPFDEGFSQSDTVRHFDMEGGVVGLATGDSPRILTSSDVNAVPINARLVDLQALVSG